MGNPEPVTPRSERIPRFMFFQTEISQRTLTAVSCVWIAAMLLPLIILSFYAHPVYDDLLHTQSVAEAWARTGSPLAALAAGWARMLAMYQNWQGTYVAMFFSAFAPSAFSESLYWISPVFTLGVLTFSAWSLSRAVTHTLLQMRRGSSLLIFAVFLTLWLAYLPGADEAIYWQSGVFYALSPAALALAVGLLIRQHAEGSRASRVAVLIICGLFLGGSTYPLALGSCVLLGLIAVFAFLHQSKARWSALVTFLTVAVSLLAVVAAPGNGVRQARSGAAMGPLAAILQGTAECLETTGRWFSPQLAAAALILLSQLWEPLAKARVSFRYPVWFTLLSFGALASAFVPAIYATGVEGGRVDRIQATLYLFFVPVALANLVYWLGWLAKRPDRINNPPTLTRGLALLCAVLAVWGLFSSAITTTPVVSSALSLLNGSAVSYDQEMKIREEAVAAAADSAESIAVIRELSPHPSLFPSDGMALQKKALAPVMHRYCAIQKLLAAYSPGAIPQTEWTRLDAWQ